jgi:hypothetical protein
MVREMNKSIVEAIQNKRIITFWYADEQGNLHKRIAEPYAYGITKQGNEALRCYQVGGTSDSVIPGWKLFLVERISSLVVGNQVFSGSAPGYAHGDKALNLIYCYLK